MAEKRSERVPWRPVERLAAEKGFPDRGENAESKSEIAPVINQRLTPMGPQDIAAIDSRQRHANRLPPCRRHRPAKKTVQRPATSAGRSKEYSSKCRRRAPWATRYSRSHFNLYGTGQPQVRWLAYSESGDNL
jgi:hypothetical protein